MSGGRHVGDGGVSGGSSVKGWSGSKVGIQWVSDGRSIMGEKWMIGVVGCEVGLGAGI